MNQRLIDFLFGLAQQPGAAQRYYPTTVGSLDPALFDQDIRTLEDLEAQGHLKLSDCDRKRGGVKVELTGPGCAWAAGLAKQPSP